MSTFQATLPEIRAWMGRRGWNQARLAAELGVTQMWLSRRFTGRVPITLAELDRIAEALGVDAAELVADSRAS